LQSGNILSFGLLAPIERKRAEPMLGHKLISPGKDTALDARALRASRQLSG